MHRGLVAGIALAWFTPGIAAQDFQFMQLTHAPEALTQLPSEPRDFLLGHDFDGDGRDDLVVTTPAGTAVYTATATGWSSGTFLNPRYVWGRARLVDFEGDGDLDLAFGPADLANPTVVHLYQNTPSGMANVALPSEMNGAIVQGIAMGDIDGNGFADMVVAVIAGSVVPSLVLARGGGPGLRYTLDMTSMPAGLPLGLWPELLDADGDGDLDVLATNATSGLRLLRNVGGSFVDATATLPPARTGHTFLRSADFDGDGRDDCAAVVGSEIDVLWGGAGGITLVQAIATRQILVGLTTADFDGDGDVDLLTQHQTEHGVLWNLGNRQFLHSGIVPGYATCGPADVDGDGADDVVYSTVGSLALRCMFGAHREAGPSGWIQPVFAMGPPAVGDVDGDGRTDLATQQVQQLTLDCARGGGHYLRRTLPQASAGGAGILPLRSELFDMDRDGDLDFVRKHTAQLAVLDNAGGGEFTPVLQSPLAGTAGDDLRVADVDADGDLDIVHLVPIGAVLVRNLGNQQYAAPVIVASGATEYVELADVDGDGDQDLIAGPAAQTILANDGAGNFAPDPRFTVAPGFGTRSLVAGDFDADGDTDLAAAGLALRLHRNDGAGTFSDTTAGDLPPVGGTTISNVVVADLDDDGDLDLGVLTSGNPALKLLFNDGTGRFADRSAARAEPALASTGSWRLRGADFDDDGDIDLIAATGSMHRLLANHLRQCRCSASPRLGRVCEVQVISGPGFGPAGLGLLGIGPAATVPSSLPGITGKLALDLAALQVWAMTLSSVGVSSAFVAVPTDPHLFGLDVWFQGAILPTVGRPGLTNAIHEVVLR